MILLCKLFLMFAGYMSMAVVHNGTECVLLALGCSDGAVR